MIDNKWRLFGKVSILDIVIAVVLIAVVAVAVVISNPAEAVSGDASASGNLTFVVELSRKEAGYESNVVVGEKVYDNLKGIYLGTITDVKVEPYKVISADLENKIYREDEVDGLISVYITVDANAERSDMTTLVNDVEIAVGKELFVRSGQFASSGYCVKMDFNGGEQ